jgi:FSR family fosmidomycin resistance protein-like MFS transporter
MTLGMLASVILWFRLKNVSTVKAAHESAGLPVRETLLQMRGLMIPIMTVTFLTGFLNANIVNYLPTFMAFEGSTFALAGASLAIVELSGTVGVLLMGIYSDRIGQRTIAILGILFSACFSFGFLMTQGWLQMAMLIGVGMSAFVANPAFLAMIQPRFVSNRALSNGVYMSTSFILRSMVVVIVGAFADRFGMRPVFFASVGLAITAIPVLFFLPKR